MASGRRTALIVIACNAAGPEQPLNYVAAGVIQSIKQQVS